MYEGAKIISVTHSRVGRESSATNVRLNVATSRMRLPLAKIVAPQARPNALFSSQRSLFDRSSSLAN